MCILLVEDEWLIRTMMAMEMMDGGFAVREAENGDQALALISQDPSVFSLLVTDIHMPGSLDGIGVARLLRQRRPDIPVIYTTGRPDVLNSHRLLEGKDVLLCKPFESTDLLAAVRRLLGQGGEQVAVNGRRTENGFGQGCLLRNNGREC